MKSRQIEEKFIDFFVRRHHLFIPQASLVPENDASLLFTSAGMVPLKPYFLGLASPPAKRLVNIQRCLRTTDIERVGKNARTLSFFEMLGSWSIGDYFKEGAISLAWEFLTKKLKLPKEKLWATYFAGDKDHPQIPPDKETPRFWRKVGMNPDHIVGLAYEDNFWQAGESGPCGPCTEVYLDRGVRFASSSKDNRPGAGDRFLEIWNAGVFMQYNRSPSGKLTNLAIRSVDTGAGLERMAMVLQNKKSIFEIDLFAPIVKKITALTSHSSYDLIFRIADHIKASVFLLADGVRPANLEQGYVLRRLIRRAIYAGKKLAIEAPLGEELVPVVIRLYEDRYPYLRKQQKVIIAEFEAEEKKFLKTIAKGKRQMKGMIEAKKGKEESFTGQEAFYLWETYGLPVDLAEEEMRAAGIEKDRNFKSQLAAAVKSHQKKSRSRGRFKSGLADHSEAVIKLHTTTHLLHQALRTVLGDHVRQVGSNITPSRLRFDFTHPRALTEKEKKAVEDLVNKKIKENLPVVREEMTLVEAKKKGALAFFADRYQEEKVSVYTIGYPGRVFSCEVCRGPHVGKTGALGAFKIEKEKAVGSGKRRIYAILK